MLMDNSRARSEVGRIKEQGRIRSNIYSEEAFFAVEDIAVSEYAVLFIRNDNGAKRLYYCYSNENDFSALLKKNLKTKMGDAVAEIVTRNPEEEAALLKALGFRPIAYMMRMSVKDISESLNTEKSYPSEYKIGCSPTPTDTKEIHSILWRLFDTRISHLQNESEVAESINNNEFTIHKNESGKIDALIQAQIQPKKFYINQIYNSADKSVIHSMLRTLLRKYVEQGGKYVYAWVDQNNIASVKFHEKYGMKHDGMWDVVYTLEDPNRCAPT